MKTWTASSSTASGSSSFIATAVSSSPSAFTSWASGRPTRCSTSNVRRNPLRLIHGNCAKKSGQQRQSLRQFVNSGQKLRTFFAGGHVFFSPGARGHLYGISDHHQRPQDGEFLSARTGNQRHRPRPGRSYSDRQRIRFPKAHANPTRPGKRCLLRTGHEEPSRHLREREPDL